jgi:hypothetical protein
MTIVKIQVLTNGISIKRKRKPEFLFCKITGIFGLIQVSNFLLRAEITCRQHTSIFMLKDWHFELSTKKGTIKPLRLMYYLHCTPKPPKPFQSKSKVYNFEEKSYQIKYFAWPLDCWLWHAVDITWMTFSSKKQD